jgi:hypothetical protein
MLTVARQFLGGELGLIETARELPKFHDGVEPEIGALLDVFVGIDSETDTLPIATEKAFWNPQALDVEESKIAAAESWWRGRADEAASQLVKLLETNP